MKKITLLLLTIFLFLVSSASRGHAISVTATNGSAAAIQAAVDQVAAAGGGDVHIPEGTWNFVEIGEGWSDARVLIPAGVNIFGAPTQRDAGGQVVEWKTVLVMPWDVPGDWYGVPTWFKIVGNSDPNKPSRISDIKLVGYRTIDPNSSTLHRGIYIDSVRDFRIDHVALEHTSGGGIIINGAECNGVIDHCRIYNIHGMDNLANYMQGNIGYGISHSRGYFSTGYGYEPLMYVLGNYTDHSVYIEDSYLSRWRHCVASGHGSHYVFRYNVIDDDFAHFSLDAHGLRDDNSAGDRWGARATEVYENNLTNAWDFRGIAQIGGGSGVWFNNYIDTSYHGNGIALYTEDYVHDETWHLKDFYLWSKVGSWTPSWYGIPSGFTEDRNVLADWGRPAYDPSDQAYPNVNSSWTIVGYEPYPYPHPLTIEAKFKLRGRLLDKNSLPVQSEILAYQQGTETAVASDQTDTQGDYELALRPGTYDVQYRILKPDFYVPNFFLKIMSIKVNESLQDLLPTITDYPAEKKIAFTINTKTKQTIQTYSHIKPKRVVVNGTSLTEVQSLSSMVDNTWYYDESQKRLHIIANTSSLPRISKLHVDERYIKDEMGQVVHLVGTNTVPYWDVQSSLPGTMNNKEGMYDLIKSSGANFVRIGINDQLYSDERYVDALDTYVEWCRQRDLYLIFEIHRSGTYGDGRLWEKTLDSDWVSNTKDFWASLADRYKDVPNVVGYGLLNEPCSWGGDNLVWNSVMDYYHQSIDAIRNVSSDSIIFVQSPFLYSKYLTDFVNRGFINRSGIVYEFHIYYHFNCVGGQGDWFGAYREAQTQEELANAKVLLEDWYDRFYIVISELGYPIFCGEFGVWATELEEVHGKYGPDPNWEQQILDQYEIMNENKIHWTQWRAYDDTMWSGELGGIPKEPFDLLTNESTALNRKGVIWSENIPSNLVG